MGDLTAILNRLESRIDEQHRSMTATMEANTSALWDLTAWKPQIQADVAHLQSGLRDLNIKLDRLSDRHEELANPAHKVFDVEDLSLPPRRNTSEVFKSATTSPRFDTTVGAQGTREVGNGQVTTVVPTPSGGEKPSATSVVMPQFYYGAPMYADASHMPLNHPLPFMEFPEFDGSSPKVWVRNAENYFDMYFVPEHLKSRLASLKFIGNAKFWSQSLDQPAHQYTWLALSTMVCDRFERDQHNILLRHFFRIKQTEGVADYIERFDVIIHQILAHDPKFSTATITNRFIDGLKDEIRSVVLVHNPPNLDAACALALLQEETTKDATYNSKKEYKKSEHTHHNSSFKYHGKSGTATSPTTPSTSGVKKYTDNGKSLPMEDNARTLMHYRKAKGLCYKCGQKWQPGHKCATQVSLHVVEEMWDFMVPPEYIHEQLIPDSDTDSDPDELCALSANAEQGTDDPTKIVRMLGNVGGKDVIILIDSGSTHTFVSENLASKWRDWSPLATPMKVQVANGQILSCTHQIVACPVWISGHAFQLPLNILPLNCYDIILGMDWLEQHSPMQVD